MAVTLAIFAAVMIVFPIWVRPHLIPPVTITSAFVPASGMSIEKIGDNPAVLMPQTAPRPSMPGAWVLSSQVVGQAGRPVDSVPTQACWRPSVLPPSALLGSQACNSYIGSLHLRWTVTYQPAGRYWAFEWIETARG